MGGGGAEGAPRAARATGAERRLCSAGILCSSSGCHSILDLLREKALARGGSRRSVNHVVDPRRPPVLPMLGLALHQNLKTEIIVQTSTLMKKWCNTECFPP